MDKMPPHVVLLSVVIAVVLWYVATVMEAGRATVKPTGGEAVIQDFGRQQNESPVRGGAEAIRCQNAEQRIQSLVDQSRYCVSDNDCTIFDYGYPIQCLTSVSKTDITRLRLEYLNYEKSCEFRVYYDCPAEPHERLPVCRENRCEVKLGTLDELRDQTFQHLGIEPSS
ncbi:MAG: hypothetical protein KJO35_01110 [Gammaproteobacteria bacterium]|nr:hypothetical protein [Gammaproteobacteria bacterium]